jgi:hypothetical protein
MNDRCFEAVLTPTREMVGSVTPIAPVASEHILNFLNRHTEGNSPCISRSVFAALSLFHVCVHQD